jgi:predicted RNase H-like HicB family nuclease
LASGPGIVGVSNRAPGAREDRTPADPAGAALDWRIVPALGENEVSMKYKVALKKSKEGYSVSCPGLPGCWSQGKTEDEALVNIQDAIREYLEAAIKISKGASVREVEVQM